MEYPNCKSRSQGSPVKDYFANQRQQVIEEQLEEEKQKSRRKDKTIERLEEKNRDIKHHCEVLEKENQLLKTETESSLAETQKEFKELEKEIDETRLNDERITQKMEERCCSATKEDIKDLKMALGEDHKHILDEIIRLQEDTKAHNETMFMEQERKRLAAGQIHDGYLEQLQQREREWKKKYDSVEQELKEAEIKRCELQKQNDELEWELKMCKKTSEQFSSTDCQNPRCTKAIENLNRQLLLEKQGMELKKLSRIPQQPDMNESLKIEYDKLLESLDVLRRVEHYFNDSFDAKGFLSDIFMDAYQQCKECLIKKVFKKIEDLFIVKPNNESQIFEMEGISHAFGLLLSHLGSEAVSTEVQRIQENVEANLHVLHQRRKAKIAIHPDEMKGRIPTLKFVQLAWKFVTQPYPIIACLPERFDEEIHKRSFQHWNEDSGDSQTLIYARPVVYRSFHGNVISKGLVGNK